MIAQEYKYMAFRQWLEHQLESDQDILVHILNWLERGFYYTKSRPLRTDNYGLNCQNDHATFDGAEFVLSS